MPPPDEKVRGQCVWSFPPNNKVLGQLILGTFSFWCFMDSVHIILIDLAPPPTEGSFLRLWWSHVYSIKGAYNKLVVGGKFKSALLYPTNWMVLMVSMVCLNLFCGSNWIQLSSDLLEPLYRGRMSSTLKVTNFRRESQTNPSQSAMDRPIRLNLLWTGSQTLILWDFIWKETLCLCYVNRWCTSKPSGLHAVWQLYPSAVSSPLIYLTQVKKNYPWLHRPLIPANHNTSFMCVWVFGCK